MEDAANSKRELRDRACERADAAPSFKSDVWRHFGLAVSGNEKRWQITRKQYADTAGLELIHTYGTLKLRVKRLQSVFCLSLEKDLPWSPTTMTLTQRWRFICFRPFISWPMMLSISLRGLSSCGPRWTGRKRKDGYLRKANNLVKHRPWHKHRHKSPRCSAVPGDVQMSRAARSEQHRRTACRDTKVIVPVWMWNKLPPFLDSEVWHKPLTVRQMQPAQDGQNPSLQRNHPTKTDSYWEAEWCTTKRPKQNSLHYVWLLTDMYVSCISCTKHESNYNHYQ